MTLSLARLTTEAVNLASARIDELDAAGIVAAMNAEDAEVAVAVGRESAAIARAIEIIADRFRSGGRLVYIGAGTSGRLGVLDASECPPTFGTPPELVVGLIAGGPQALSRAVEGAEDSRELAAADLAAINLSARDVLVGIATSGRTPYVLGGLAHARSVGAFAIGFACNDNSELEAVAELMIVPRVGPEIVTGSTRLKAGTATKMVLNMLTTGAMIRIGKTYGNLMVDLRATNTKLVARTRRIVAMLTGVTEDEAERLVAAADGELKTAVVAQKRGVTPLRRRTPASSCSASTAAVRSARRCSAGSQRPETAACRSLDGVAVARPIRGWPATRWRGGRSRRRSKGRLPTPGLGRGPLRPPASGLRAWDCPKIATPCSRGRRRRALPTRRSWCPTACCRLPTVRPSPGAWC